MHAAVVAVPPRHLKAWTQGWMQLDWESNTCRRMLIRSSVQTYWKSAASIIGKESASCFSKIYLWVPLKHAPLRRSFYPIGESSVLVLLHWRTVRPHIHPQFRVKAGIPLVHNSCTHSSYLSKKKIYYYLLDGVLQGNSCPSKKCTTPSHRLHRSVNSSRSLSWSLQHDLKLHCTQRSQNSQKKSLGKVSATPRNAHEQLFSLKFFLKKLPHVRGMAFNGSKHLIFIPSSEHKTVTQP